MTETRNRFGCAILGDCIYLIGGERERGRDWRREATCYRPIIHWRCPLNLINEARWKRAK